MSSIDLAIVRAQVGLAFLIAVGFLVLLGALIFAQTSLTQTTVTIVTGLLSVLGTILTLQMNYFFARHRPTTTDDSDDASATPTDKSPSLK